MIISLLLHCLVPLLLMGTGTGNPRSDQSLNKFVAYKVNVDKHSFTMGTKGTLLFTLQPKQGIHINIEPGPTFSFDSSCGISSGGKLEVSKDDSSGFLSKQKPIKQIFFVPKNFKSGTISVKGTLIYYYCSDAEGWCSRFKQPVETTIEVKP
jgi:hypothetical protein